MSNTLLAWRNYLTQSGATLAADSEESTLPVTNLSNDQGAASAAWQTPSGVVTSAGGAKFTVTPVATGQTWRVFGLFRTNLTASAVVNFALKNGSTTVASASATPIAGYGQVVAVLPADTTANYLQVSIDDPSNPDGCINVPLAYAGPAWLPATGASWQSTLDRASSVAMVVSRGGSQFPRLYWQARAWNFALDGIRALEVWPQLDSLRQSALLSFNTLFIPDITSANLQQTPVYGLLSGQTPMSFPYQAADRFRWGATITERL
jgi:hypothetical protein